MLVEEAMGSSLFIEILYIREKTPIIANERVDFKRHRVNLKKRCCGEGKTLVYKKIKN
ncbi:hypothetical protein SAMN05660297_02898 [Natronincola peptidivorans]|uniref:Uncharacterized protein n=1 Tax=Natronincola peptidivorans TaxID=426128 RepID=A0A1I0FR27_9FIRM|nr:hypothetical protein SAMN05660297_02898 [Natronincola peptidivorans]